MYLVIRLAVLDQEVRLIVNRWIWDIFKKDLKDIIKSFLTIFIDIT